MAAAYQGTHRQQGGLAINAATSNTLAVAEALLLSFAASVNTSAQPSSLRGVLPLSNVASFGSNNTNINPISSNPLGVETFHKWIPLIVQSLAHSSIVQSSPEPRVSVSLSLPRTDAVVVNVSPPRSLALQMSVASQLVSSPCSNAFSDGGRVKLIFAKTTSGDLSNGPSSSYSSLCSLNQVVHRSMSNKVCNPLSRESLDVIDVCQKELPREHPEDSSADSQSTVTFQAASVDSDEPERSRDGLAILANCAIYRPESDTSKTYAPGGPGPVQVKVEPEVELLDYELTAMTSPNLSPYYERLNSGETTTTEEYNDLNLLYLSSELSSPERETTVNPNDEYKVDEYERDFDRQVSEGRDYGRWACPFCTKCFPTAAAYEKHATVHRYYIDLRLNKIYIVGLLVTV